MNKEINDKIGLGNLLVFEATAVVLSDHLFSFYSPFYCFPEIFSRLPPFFIYDELNNVIQIYDKT